MNVILQCLVKDELEMRAFRAVAIIVLSLVIVVVKGSPEPGFCALDVVGDLREISEFERCPVLSHQAHQVYAMKSQLVLLQGIFLLGEIIGLINQIYVFGFHFIMSLITKGCPNLLNCRKKETQILIGIKIFLKPNTLGIEKNVRAGAEASSKIRYPI